MTGNALLITGAANTIAGNFVLGGKQMAGGATAVKAATAGKIASKVNSIAQIATVGVTSAAQIAAILSAGKGSKSSGGAAAGGSAEGASSPPPALPTISGASAPQIQTTGGMNATQQIGETISASQRPIKAYVVSGDITSQQALDRRTNRAATFSAG